jgi:hypothetical protein
MNVGEFVRFHVSSRQRRNFAKTRSGVLSALQGTVERPPFLDGRAHSRVHRAPHETLFSLLAKVKQQRRALAAFLKSGWADPFWKSRAKRGPVRRASRAVVCASRDRGDPDGREGLQRGLCLMRDLGVTADEHS